MRFGRIHGWQSGCLALVLGIGTGDPTRVDRRYVLYESASLPEKPPDRATVFVVREQRARLSPLPYEHVYVDEAAAGLLPQASWFVLHLEPGRHRFSGIVTSPDLILECRPGRMYLLRLREVIDDRDVLTARFLLDDPEVAADLIARKRLAFVETTPGGMDYLRNRRRPVTEANQSPVIETGLRQPPDTLSHIMVEKPLDQVNIRRDFSGLLGRIMLDRAALRFRMDDSLRSSFSGWRHVRDSVDIPGARILKVRFDGTRFTGVSPWINILYRDAGGVWSISFADAREAEACETYNRMFANALDLMETHRELARHAQADSVAVQGSGERAREP